MKAQVFFVWTLVLTGLFDVGQKDLFAEEIIYEDFNDGDFADSSPGTWVKDCLFSCGTDIGVLNASSGDLVMDTTQTGGFMWAAELRSVNDERLVRREGWSIRTLLTLDEGRRAGPGLGSPTLGFAVVQWFGPQLGGGLTVGQRQDQNVVYFDDIDTIYGKEFYVQLDAFDDVLTGYAWLAEEPSHIYSTAFEGVTSPSHLPVVWNNAAASTFKDVMIWTTPIPLPTAEAIACDFNADGACDVDDIDALNSRIRTDPSDVTYDLNDDGTLDQEDRQIWVKELKQTYFGDANLDGEFNSGDMVEVFTAGKYELAVEAGWAEGDWTGDQRFDSGDLVAAFQDGGYELGPRVEMNIVPETSPAILLSFGLIGLFRIRRTLYVSHQKPS